MAGEDARVDDEEVVRAVDLSVHVYDGGSAVAAVVGSELGGACDPLDRWVAIGWHGKSLPIQ